MTPKIMFPPDAWKFRIKRSLGRFVTTAAAVLTLGHMPPFVSASAVVIDDGRILAVLDPIRDEPVLPGGHLKWREPPVTAVVREVREETGYRVQPGSLICVVGGDELAGEPGIVRVIYDGTIVGGELRSSEEGEALWLPVAKFEHDSSRDASIVRGWRLRSGIKSAT